MTALGLDLSHYQRADRINWQAAAQSHRFAIINACDGTEPDPAVSDHWHRARDVALTTGLYLFYRPDQPTHAQWSAFSEIADDLHMGPGNLLPAIDLEDWPNAPIGPEHSEQARILAASFANRWGGCLLYLSDHAWRSLGKPRWITDHRLWVAHHTEANRPLCPAGMRWSIWQRRVAPIPAIYGGNVLDQDIARLPLPLIPGPSIDRRRIGQLISLTADQSYRESRER